MKRKHIFTSIIFSILILLNLSCSNGFMSEPDEEKQINCFAEVSFGISGFEKTAENDGEIYDTARTVLPENDDISDVKKFTISGSCVVSAERTDTLDESFLSYSDLQNASFELYPGKWTFTLTAYKLVDSEYKAFASGTLSDVQLSVYDSELNNVQTLSFTLDYSCDEITKGELMIIVDVPYHQLAYAEVNGTYTSESGTTTTLEVTKLDPSDEEDDSGSYVSFYSDDMPAGFYVLRFDFYTKKNDESAAEKTNSRVYFAKVQGGRSTASEFTVGHLNNKYVLDYVINLPEDETISWPNEASRQIDFNSSQKITLPAASELSTEHYTFDGWYSDSECTTAVTGFEKGQAASITVYGKWTPKQYTVKFADFAGGQSAAKTYSGGTAEVTMDYGAAIPDGTFANADTLLSDGNTVTFAGWYSDAACTAANKVTSVTSSLITIDSDADGTNDTAQLYAKWNYKYVYVDPSNTTTTAADTNYGYSKTTALASFTEAKAYLNGNTAAQKVYLCSSYDVSSSDAADAISGITTDTYNNAIVQRYTDFTRGTMVTVTAADLTISNVTLDGGAVWDEDGSTGTNSGVAANNTAIYLNASGTVTLNTVAVQNNDNTNGSGGGIDTIAGAEAVLNNCSIMNNAASTTGGGIYICTAIKMTGGTISGNYSRGGSSGTGGGITVRTTKDSYSYLKNVEVTGNTAVGSGGGISITNSFYLRLDGCSVHDNETSVYGSDIYNAGRLYVSGASYIGNIYLHQTTYGVIFPRNYLDTASGVTETSNLTKQDGKEFVAYLTTSKELPQAAYDSSVADTYVTVLKEEKAGDIGELYKLFQAPDPDNYSIGTYQKNASSTAIGYIYLTGTPSAQSGSGSISSNVYENLTSSISVNTVYTASDTQIVFSVNDKSDNDITSEITGLSFSFWSEGTDISSASYFETDTENHKVTVKQGIPAGTDLIIKISYTYSGVAYEDEYALTVEEASE